jgi:hypothetical protein
MSEEPDEPTNAEGWRPIESAPKDWFDPIDLWAGGGPRFGEGGQRHPDCWWTDNPEDGRGPGWYCNPMSFYGDGALVFRVDDPTHWRLKPGSPAGQARPTSWAEFDASQAGEDAEIAAADTTDR